MRYLAIAFAAGICAGWFLRRCRSRNDGDLPPLLFIGISIIAELTSAACGGNADRAAAAQPLRRAWTLERQVSECRRRAFNGQVGSDTRAVKAFFSFARTRWEMRFGTGAYAAFHWMRYLRSRRTSRASNAAEGLTSRYKVFGFPLTSVTGPFASAKRVPDLALASTVETPSIRFLRMS